MAERRGALVVAATIVAVLIVGAIGWALGRSTAPDAPGNNDTAGGPIRSIGGIPVGVQHSRAGALAASDNYVALGSETITQDPARYTRLVRTVYEPGYQRTALTEAKQVRASSADAVANYEAGGRGVALVAARRLDTYSDSRAMITTWLGGFSWGPKKKPGQTWYLTESTLRWDGQRWLVEKIDTAARPAPAPTNVGYDDKSALTTPTFDRELRGMTGPLYGAAGQ